MARRSRTAKEIAASHKVPAIGLKCDVSQAADVDRTVSQIAERLGSLDILVNNAGITRDNLIHKMTDEDWDLVTAVHLRGAFLCSRAAQREMVKRNWGRIINLSSVSALGNRGQTNYSTAKAGLQGMARTLAIELGRYGVTANAIAPGFIDTEMTRATAIRLGRDPRSGRRSAPRRSRSAAPACRATSPILSPSCAATKPLSSPARSFTSPAAPAASIGSVVPRLSFRDGPEGQTGNA